MVVGVRRHMPRRRSGHTTTVTIGAERFCLTANQRDDGSLGEVFIHWGKHGTSAAGLVCTYAMALSLGLQHQVPLTDYENYLGRQLPAVWEPREVCAPLFAG